MQKRCCHSSGFYRMDSSLPLLSRSLLQLFLVSLLLLEGGIWCGKVGNGHMMNKGKITKMDMAAKSSCVIQKAKDGFELIYKKGDGAAKSGCVLDLLTLGKGLALPLKVGVRSTGGQLRDCLDDGGYENKINDNLLPFTVSLENYGTKYALSIGNEKDCSNKNQCFNHGGQCLKNVNYGVGFGRSNDKLVPFVSPIGEPRLYYCDSSKDTKKKEESFIFKILPQGKNIWEARENGCSSTTVMDYKPSDMYCHHNGNFQKPVEWKIDDPSFKAVGSFNYLFTLHIMPQNVVPKHGKGQRGQHIVPGFLDATKLPKCDMFIFFHKDHFKLLGGDVVGESSSTAPYTGTGSPPTESSSDETDTTVGGTEASSGMGLPIIIAIVVGVLLLLALIGGAVWFFVLRGKGEGEEGMEMGMTGAGGGTKTKTKAGTTVGATQAKTGMTTVGGTQAKTGMTTAGGGTKGGAASKAAGTTKGGATSKAGAASKK